MKAGDVIEFGKIDPNGLVIILERENMPGHFFRKISDITAIPVYLRNENWVEQIGVIVKKPTDTVRIVEILSNFDYQLRLMAS